MTACGHPILEGGEIIEPAEFIQAFGPTVGRDVPAYPGYNLLRNDSRDPVSMSRLECGHFLMTSPSIAAQARSKAAAELMAGNPGMTAQAAYTALLERAYQGEEVSARDAAEAQAAIILAGKAEEGRAERAHAESLKAEQEQRAAVEGPVRRDLTESRENLQDAQDEAFRAVMALLDAVDLDHEAQDQAFAELIDGGFRPEEARPPAQGYLHRTVVGGESFPFWPKMEHLVAVLNAVRYTRHRNAFYSTEGRDLGKYLPAPIPNGPVISPGADEG